VAVCCSVLQSVAVCPSRPWTLNWQCVAVCCSVLQCVAVCCSVLQCVPKDPGPYIGSDQGNGNKRVAVCCIVFQRVAVCCSVFVVETKEAILYGCKENECVAVCCSVFLCIAVWCILLQCVASGIKGGRIE